MSQVRSLKWVRALANRLRGVKRDAFLRAGAAALLLEEPHRRPCLSSACP